MLEMTNFQYLCRHETDDRNYLRMLACRRYMLGTGW